MIIVTTMIIVMIIITIIVGAAMIAAIETVALRCELAITILLIPADLDVVGQDPVLEHLRG